MTTPADPAGLLLDDRDEQIADLTRRLAEAEAAAAEFFAMAAQQRMEPAQAVIEERRRIVAWLRADARARKVSKSWTGAFRYIANQIEEYIP